VSEKVVISSLNKRGEGVAVASCGNISVPFTLPQETVEIELIQSKDKNWGQIIEITTASADRQDPLCEHFGVCGGCSLQHLNQDAYTAFKKSQVTNPLQAAGFDPNIVMDPILIGPHQRRRIDFLTRKFPDGMTMGFYQVNSRRRINLKTCTIVDPRIEALFPTLEILLDQILDMKELVHVFILAADNGIDLLLAGFKRTLTDGQKATLMEFATKHDLARLSYKIKRQSHEIYLKEEPYVTFAGHKMAVDPNVFLQASPKADEVLSKLVLDAIPENAKVVADLFCGRGTLSLPILKSGRYVLGYEGDKHAIAALQELDAPGLDPQVRDLFENPLSAGELKPFHAVVMNPPRSGVKGQIAHLAAARVPTIIYVSCNPESFAQDMAQLCTHGYKLEKVTPVDQFTWSHHVEVVGVASLIPI
jgi:23S rRNA (uracil1939-C5)-methyltransferase